MTMIPDGPETVQELLLFLDEHPDKAHLYRPSAYDAQMMGLDPACLRAPEPIAESFRRQLIATCRDDREFCQALKMLILGGDA